jgi:hypothetical protein
MKVEVLMTKMKKILFLIFYFLVANTRSYAADKTLLCSGIKHTGGLITHQEQINFNYIFDDANKTLTLDNAFLCNGYHQLPLIKTIDFNKNQIYYHSKTSDNDLDKCVTNLVLNRNSGELKWLQIIGDIKSPAFIYEGKFQCELAKQKF